MSKVVLDYPTAAKVLLVTSNWWPLSARLAIALLRHGCAVAALCPPGHPLHYVTGVTEIHPYRRVGSRRSLLAAIHRARPDAVVPCDDRSVAQLHELHELHPHLRPLIERSLGSASGFGFAQSRGRLLDLARELGIRVPGTCVVGSAEHAVDCYSHYGPAALLKLDGTYGGEGVEIVRSPAEAAAAFARMRGTGLGLATALKRSLVNRDPLALWGWGRKSKPAVTMQRFVAGTPANIMVASWEGKILADASVEAVSCQGSTGAANVVRVIRNEEMRQAAALLAARLGVSGFFGLDFILERSTGAAYLIEMNPRCTQLGHLPLAPQGDLAGTWFAALTGRSASRGESGALDTIAFFPQALRWGAQSDYLDSVHHDVPWEERRLVELLMREPWPERQWSARAYHWFRRATPTEAVAFDPAVRVDEEPGQSRAARILRRMSAE